jgi:hypothetical protein
MRLYVAGQTLSLFGDTAPQTVSIALGALLVAFVDYRLMLLLEAVAVAGAGAWLLTRREQRVSTPV